MTRPRRRGRVDLGDAGRMLAVRVPPQTIANIDAAAATSDPPLTRSEFLRAYLAKLPAAPVQQ